jgi:phage terminase large subunit-like protein
MDDKKELLMLLAELDRRRSENKIGAFYPDEGPLRRGLYKPHMEFFAAGSWARERCMIAANGIGKCLPLDAPIIMSNGEVKRLDEIKIGDAVLGYDVENGDAFPTFVTDVVRSGEMEVFETTFADGGKVRCTIDHWMPGYKKSGRYKYNHGKKTENKPEKRKFREYIGGEKNTPSSRYSFLSPKLTHFEFIVENKEISPYVVGALLGDGGLNNDGITFTTIDQGILDRIYKHLYPKYINGISKDSITYRLLQNKDGRNGLLSDAFKRIGIYPLSCENKRVPRQYLCGTVDERKELLAGLIDTDGSQKEFSSKSKQLVLDFVFLVRSLGGKATYKEKVVNGVIYYRAYWIMEERLPLTLTRKQQPIPKRPIDYSRRIIRKIESIGMHQCGCITVKHKDHCFIAYDWVAVGNTEGVGAFEITCHLTGNYPAWWKGRVFAKPVRAWVAGKTNTTTRDILQAKLLGKPGAIGTGMIPKKYIDLNSVRSRPGVPDAIESVRVLNENGGHSWLSFKSFEQGRGGFEGTEIEVIWLDEECPALIYDECLMRTRTVNGMIMLTFTPLQGLTDLVLGFMPNNRVPDDGKVNASRFVNQATWNDAPHLTEKEKSEILSNTLPHLRDARSKGIPLLSSGMIFPIAEEDITVDDFEVPVWFRRVYGLDYGWNWTAAVWLAHDESRDMIYVTDVYKRGIAEPPVHIAAIKARGSWIPGVADPAGGTSQRDGRKLLNEYQEALGDLFPANHAVDAGLLRIWQRMITGKLKVLRVVASGLTSSEFIPAMSVVRLSRAKIILWTLHDTHCTAG